MTTKNAFFKFKTKIENLTTEAELRVAADVEGETEAEKEEHSEKSIDLEKVVEEEIERSMIEPKEDDSDDSDEDEAGGDLEDEDLLHDVSSFFERDDIDSADLKSRRKLPTMADSSIIEDSDNIL